MSSDSPKDKEAVTIMKVRNPNYFYGKKIIWNVYRRLLRRERMRCIEQREMLECLGQRLLGHTEDFSVVEFMDVFNRLEEEQRKLLQMKYVYDFSHKELAEYYGVHVSRISHRLSDCRNEFRRLWEGGR